MKHEELAAVELRTMRSAWRALAGRWDLDARERIRLMPEGGEGDENPPRDTEARMRILIEIGYRVGLSEADLHEWLRTPSGTLHWLTPLDVMSGTMAQLREMRRMVDMGFAS